MTTRSLLLPPHFKRSPTISPQMRSLSIPPIPEDFALTLATGAIATAMRSIIALSSTNPKSDRSQYHQSHKRSPGRIVGGTAVGGRICCCFNE